MILTLALLFFILGTVWGSFLSVVVKRSPSGRSHCPRCKKTLGPLDLIPIASYIMLRGKCRHCKKPIPIYYPGLEIICGLTFVLVYLKFMPLTTAPVEQIGKLIAFLVITLVLLFIFFYDLFKLEIPDKVIMPSIVGGFLLSTTPLIDTSFWSGLIGASGAVIFFGGQMLVSNGVWVGGGDLKLGAFMGFILGWKLMLVALVTAYVIGGIVGLALIVTKRADRKTAIPFGPFLVLGAFTAFFVGEYILTWFTV